MDSLFFVIGGDVNSENKRIATGDIFCLKRCPRGLDVGDRRHFKQISSPERAKKRSVATF